MSDEGVDPLEAMTQAMRQLRSWQKDHGQDLATADAINGLRAARKAVGELIDAVEDVYAPPCMDGEDVPCPPGCKSCRIRDALIRNLGG